MNVYMYQRILATIMLLIMAGIVVGIFLLVSKRNYKLTTWIKKYGMQLGLTIGIAALAGSLGLSEGFHLPPCKFCWWQRIMHYPQILIFAIGIKKKEPYTWLHSIWLAVIGFGISMYQILMQFIPSVAEATICSTNPSVGSCSDILVMEYGFITVPVMSATLFAALIVLYLIQKKKA